MSNTHTKQDTNTSTQVHGSAQLQTVLQIVQPQDEQNIIAHQLKSKQQSGKLINGLFIGIALILMIIGTIVWVLSIIDMIKGPWAASICAALFSVIGALIQLLQIYVEVATKPQSTITITHLQSDAQIPNGDVSLPRPSGQEGIVVVCEKCWLRSSSTREK
jgi:hypothetical protein